MDVAVHEKLRANLAGVESRIAAACARAGRARSEVTLVAVTKTVSAKIAAMLPELGVFDLGENRPQELWRKSEILPKSIRWHMIGHLQRNKIERTLPLVALVHAVDSVRLLQALEQQQRPIRVLLEVNVSGETSKQGFAPSALPDLVPMLGDLKHVKVSGLMTMAALQEPEACRPAFVTLRQLRDQLRTNGLPDVEHLSMGMSNDFEIAIEEGATLVRLGTVLFEGISEPEA
ncbi:MAG: YggS family pyridoxal phosphate-dependent enzyme [Planctomycetes bacterium]|nr:YggS family pyridoxal phosphate-dependent enzyme [Planctomycetota bacterium]